MGPTSALRRSAHPSEAHTGQRARSDPPARRYEARSLTLAEQEREASDTERAQLARWSGWGACAELFDEWRRERDELRKLVGEEGYAEARRTTINAHYTHPAIAQAMWRLAGELGFTGGEVIEPGGGAGVFIGLPPDDAQVVGVELDTTTAAIAEQLYLGAKIINRSFAEPARGLCKGGSRWPSATCRLPM